MKGEMKYVDEEEKFEVEKDEMEEKRVPPRPVPLYPYNEDTDPKKFDGDRTDIPRRAAFKLFNVWMLWLNIRCNRPIEDMLKKESAQDSDEYKLKCVIIEILDKLAKILIDGDILEEVGELTSQKSTDTV